MKRFIQIVALALSAASLTMAQGVPPFKPGAPDLKSRGVEMQLTSPPRPVQSGSASRVGGAGLGTNYYWVVAQNTIGAAQPAGPYVCTNLPASLNSSNYCSISWTPMQGALTYDVLLMSTPTAPVGACNCSVATGVTGATYNDQSGSLSSYVVSPIDPNLYSFLVTNEQISAGVSAYSWWFDTTSIGYFDSNGNLIPNTLDHMVMANRYSSLQAALNTGLDVYVPSPYTVTANGVTLAEGQHLVCASPIGSVIQVPAGATGFQAPSTTVAVHNVSIVNCNVSLLGIGSIGVDALCMDHLTLRDVLVTSAGGSSGQVGTWFHGGDQCPSYYGRVQTSRYAGLAGTGIKIEDAANDVVVDQSKIVGNQIGVSIDGGTCFGNAASSCLYGPGLGNSVNTASVINSDIEQNSVSGVDMGQGGVAGAITYNPHLINLRFEGNAYSWRASAQVQGYDLRDNWYTGPGGLIADNSLNPTRCDIRSFSGGPNASVACFQVQDINVVANDPTYNPTIRISSDTTGATFIPNAVQTTPVARNVLVIPVTPNNHFYQLTGLVAGTGVCGPDPGSTWDTTGAQTATISNFSLTSNVVTLTTSTQGYAAGQQVKVAGLTTTGTYLNGWIATVSATGLTTTQIEFSFTHANDSGTGGGTGTTTGTTVTGDCIFTDFGQNNAISRFMLSNAVLGDIGGLFGFTNGLWGLFSAGASIPRWGIIGNDSTGSSASTGAIWLNAKNTGTGTGGTFFGDGNAVRRAWIDSGGRVWFNCASDLTNCGELTGTFTAPRTLTVQDASGAVTLSTNVAGTIALPTSTLTAGTCSTAATLAVASVTTTNIVNWSFNGDPTGVTGYGAGGLQIKAYPSAGVINAKVCNPTAGSITPGALTINVRALVQ